MYDYPEKVKQYIFQNFEPSTPKMANTKMSTGQLLKFLFVVFPKDCISDYELTDILFELGYKPYNELEIIEEETEEGEEWKSKSKESKTKLRVYWCLNSFPNIF